MALSPRLPAKPGTSHANHSVDRFADLAAHAGLLALSHELRGRSALALSDFAEVECRIAARHAALDRLSIELEYNRGALLDMPAAEGQEARA